MEEKKGKEIEWMIHIDSNMHKEFLTVAQANDRSATELVREFIKDYVHTHKTHQPLVEQPDQRHS